MKVTFENFKTVFPTIKGWLESYTIEEFTEMEGFSEFYGEDPDITAAIDNIIADMQKAVDAHEKPSEPQKPSEPKAPSKPKKPSEPKTSSKPKKTYTTKEVDSLTTEVKIIGDFVKLHKSKGAASKVKDDARKLLNRLQDAIVSKKIRKTSDYAEDIKKIQSMLIKFINSRNTGKIELSIDNIDHYREIAKSETVSSNVEIARKVIRIQNTSPDKKRVTKLLELINKSIANQIANDEIKSLVKPLENYSEGKADTITIEERSLRGLKGMAGVSGLGNVEEEEIVSTMSSEDLLNKKFKVINLYDPKWIDFIGRPSEKFKMMVYGMPGNGKSTFCIQFAGLLTKELGLKALYISSEERFGYTLRDKLIRLGVANANLDIAESVPDNIESYDVIFFDSINDMKIDPEALMAITKKKATVAIYQCTKDGKYKGVSEYAHDCDVKIRVESMRAFTEKNRFAPAGKELEV